jgi:hypothetical protein
MSEFGGSVTSIAGAVAIVLLLVLMAEHELLRVAPGARVRSRRSALLIAIVPLLVVFVLVVVLRLTPIAQTRP